MRSVRALALIPLVLFLAFAACTTDVVVDGHDHGDEEDVLLSDPDLPNRHLFAAGATVGDVARTACSTAGVKPLAQRLPSPRSTACGPTP